MTPISPSYKLLRFELAHPIDRPRGSDSFIVSITAHYDVGGVSIASPGFALAKTEEELASALLNALTMARTWMETQASTTRILDAPTTRPILEVMRFLCSLSSNQRTDTADVADEMSEPSTQIEHDQVNNLLSYLGVDAIDMTGWTKAQTAVLAFALEEMLKPLGDAT